MHASPGSDDGEGIHPGRSDQELKEIISECDADIICVGHTHEPMNRLVDGKTVINLGSVSNPCAPDLRASYVLLKTCKESFELIHRRVPDDHQSVIEQVEQSGHPARDFITHFQKGMMLGREPHPDHLRSETSATLTQNPQCIEPDAPGNSG